MNASLSSLIQVYHNNLLQITTVLKRTRAKLIYFSTTPSPNNTICCPNGRNKLPPGELGVTNCPIVVEQYNAVAKEVMAQHGVEWVDLYSVVEARCGGRGYKSCIIQPQSSGPHAPGTPGSCNVHFTDYAKDPATNKTSYVGGWAMLADVVISAVRKALPPI